MGVSKKWPLDDKSFTETPEFSSYHADPQHPVDRRDEEIQHDPLEVFRLLLPDSGEPPVCYVSVDAQDVVLDLFVEIKGRTLVGRLHRCDR